MGSKGAAIWSAMMNRMLGRFMGAFHRWRLWEPLAIEDATVDNMGKAHAGQ